MYHQKSLFENRQDCENNQVVVNVASVPHRSPFRYPGGKTWLVPVVRKWLKHIGPVSFFHEPFAGGGIISLTVGFESFAKKIKMVELDSDISAVWQVLFYGDTHCLAKKILNFDLTPENVDAELFKQEKTLFDSAFCTILKNRIFRGGILAKGSGMMKSGENGKGLKSRWYPKTLHDRILAIDLIKDKFIFEKKDAFVELEKYSNKVDFCFFIDPPYTVAGGRLYKHFDIDHYELFKLTSKLKGHFMMTYDDTEEIRDLANSFGLEYRTIPMKTTHHVKKQEIIICNDFSWW